MGYIVRGKYVITEPKIGDRGLMYDAAVYIQGENIEKIGSFKNLSSEYPEAEITGSPGDIVMPGMIDAHTHGRGMSFIQRGGSFDFLENALLDWPSVIDLPPELNSSLCALRHMMNGCTMLHHNEMGKVLDSQAYSRAAKTLQGYREIGIRHAYSPGIRDINFLAYDDEGFLKTLPRDLFDFASPLVHFNKSQAREEYFDLFERLFEEADGNMTRVFLGPCWAHGATDEYLQEIRACSDSHGGIPVHMHTLQTLLQKKYGEQRFGKSLVKHLDDFGILDQNLTLGHAVHLGDDDIALLAKRGISVTHHPSCNLSMRNGIARVYDMHIAGINIAIGMDEKSINDDEDIFMELRMAYSLARLGGGTSLDAHSLTPFDVLAMATGNAAHTLGAQRDVGALKAGMKADIIVLDANEILNAPCSAPSANFETLFIHRARGSQVKHVIINGRKVMLDRKILTIDADALYREVCEYVKQGMSEQQKAFAQRLQKLKPYYKKWYENFIVE